MALSKIVPVPSGVNAPSGIEEALSSESSEESGDVLPEASAELLAWLSFLLPEEELFPVEEALPVEDVPPAEVVTAEVFRLEVLPPLLWALVFVLPADAACTCAGFVAAAVPV